MPNAPTTRAKILARIKRLKPGEVFTAKDFLALASRSMVDLTLKELADAGDIRRIARGLYDRPAYSSFLRERLAPNVDEIARAYARRFHWRIVPGGALAANLLGLSTQVPSRPAYLTDGPDKLLQIDAQTVEFKHAPPRDLGDGRDRFSSMFIQAVRFLGEAGMDDAHIERLREHIPPVARRRLLRTARYAADWIFALAQKVAAD